MFLSVNSYTIAFGDFFSSLLALYLSRNVRCRRGLGHRFGGGQDHDSQCTAKSHAYHHGAGRLTYPGSKRNGRLVGGRESRTYTTGRFRQLGAKRPGRPRRSPSVVAEIAENRQGQGRRYPKRTQLRSGIPGSEIVNKLLTQVSTRARAAPNRIQNPLYPRYTQHAAKGQEVERGIVCGSRPSTDDPGLRFGPCWQAAV